METLSFELTVNGSAKDSVNVNVLEHSGTAFFVDGDNGSDDSGDGSQANPFAFISKALSQVNDNNTDVYVRTRNNARHDETQGTLSLPAGTSLYGGYDAAWVWDASNNRIRVDAIS